MEQPELPVEPICQVPKASKQPKEWKVVSLRECPTPEAMQMCDTPQRAVDYWRLHIPTTIHFNPECECFVVLMLNTRRRVRGHQLVSIGTMDTLLVHPREVFRTAITAGAAAIVLMHTVHVAFQYATLKINSDPEGATILDRSKVLATTPATLDLKPSAYRLQIQKEGYFGTNINVTLSETNTERVTVQLVNVSWAEAIERAERRASGFIADYDAALRDIDTALRIKPGDLTALRLKRDIEFSHHIRNARQLLQNNSVTEAAAEAEAAAKLKPDHADLVALRADVDQAKALIAKAQAAAAEAKALERRARPQKVLNEVTSKIRHDELFVSQKLRFDTSLSQAQERLTRALGKKPEWRITRNQTSSGGVAIIQAEKKTFGGRQNVAIVLSQTTDTEVTICFKLFVYTLGSKIQVTLGGITEDSYKPLHPSYVPPVRASGVETEIKQHIDEFKKRIEEEFR